MKKILLLILISLTILLIKPASVKADISCPQYDCPGSTYHDCTCDDSGKVVSCTSCGSSSDPNSNTPTPLPGGYCANLGGGCRFSCKLGESSYGDCDAAAGGGKCCVVSGGGGGSSTTKSTTTTTTPKCRWPTNYMGTCAQHPSDCNSNETCKDTTGTISGVAARAHECCQTILPSCTVGDNGEADGNCGICSPGGDDKCGTFSSTQTCTKTKIRVSNTSGTWQLSSYCTPVTNNVGCQITDKKCVDTTKTCVNNVCTNPGSTTTTISSSTTTTGANSTTTTTLEANCSIVSSAIDFVLDRSGSMGSKQSGSTLTKLDYLKTAVKSFIGKLPDSGIIGLQSFGGTASNDFSIATLQGRRDAINTKIDLLSAKGGTPLKDALTKALSEIQTAKQNASYKDYPYALILFSDGLWNTGGDPTPVVQQLKAINVRIFAIAYGAASGTGINFMKATATSPTDYYYAPKDTDIQPILDSIQKKVCITLTPTPTVTPEPTTTPTPTPAAGNTVLSLIVGLDGIGTTGDNQNPEDKNCSNANDPINCGSNKTPGHETRDVTVEFLTTGNTPVSTFSGLIKFAPESGKFLGTVDLGSNFTGGSYMIKIKSPGYLKKIYPSIQAITAGTTNSLPSIRLVTGNVNQDSSLDIMDYNILMSCSIFSSDSNGACNQNPNYVIKSDLEDNSTIDQLDYNLLMREWVNQIEQQ
jgi:uncharacterized protein YegL